jgi:cephalosporin hydroxylase
MRINNINFCFGVCPPYKVKSSVEKIFVLKPKFILDQYLKMLPSDKPVTILELGVFEAGSAIALASMNPMIRVVGIDNSHKPHLDEIIRAHGLKDRIHLYHNIDQQDEERLLSILKKECESNAIDMIIDDCSHLYGPTRKSFEVLFPYLKRGGQYIIEDWNWAHAPGEYQTTKWIDQPALSNLIFELTILIGSSLSRDIEKILIQSNLAVFTKGSETNPATRLNITNNIRMRNKKLTHI